MTSRLAVRLLLAMSVEDAKLVLGLPPGRTPSPVEIQKAYRSKALQNHPDRGGDPTKMVEINVAKEILEGKRVNDRTPFRQPQEDPEVTRKRKAKIRLEVNIAATLLDKEKAEEAMARMWSSVDYLMNGYRMDLAEFLTDDLTYAMQQINVDADDGIAHAPDARERRDWDLALELSTALIRESRVVAAKYIQLKKGLKIVKNEPNIRDMQTLDAEAREFFAAFGELRKKSGRLSQLVATSEVVPARWDSLYISRNHQIIVSFDDDYKKYSPKHLAETESQVERSVDATLVRLESEYNIRWDNREWSEWRVPSEFDAALRHLREVQV